MAQLGNHRQFLFYAARPAKMLVQHLFLFFTFGILIFLHGNTPPLLIPDSNIALIPLLSSRGRHVTKAWPLLATETD